MRLGRVAYDRDHLEELSPAEKLVESAAPASMSGDDAMEVVDDGEVLRPWEPKGEEALGAPPERTIEGDRLVHSPGPPQEVGGGSPSAFNSFGRWLKDE